MQWNIGFVNNYTTWLTRRIAVIYHTATYVGSKSCRVNHAIFTTVKVNTYPLFERLPVNWGQRILHFRDQSNNSLCAGLKFTLWRIFPPNAGWHHDKKVSYHVTSGLAGKLFISFMPTVFDRTRNNQVQVLAKSFQSLGILPWDTSDHCHRLSVSFGVTFNKESDIQRYKFTNKHSTY